jgi:crotonobetainyl-CoA:carnitine CoA-transferase CaiB-like acyl-CoA transferase
MPQSALEGVSVIELAQGVAGPYTGRLLAAHGARVIKVEPPEGDAGRALLPRRDEGETIGASGLFAWLNMRKESVCLDLSLPGDVEQLRTLIASSDLVIDDAFYEIRAAQGLDPAELRKENPAMSWLAMTWFGQTGPYRDHPGSDGIISAQAGLANAVGIAGGAPMLSSGYVPQIVTGVTGAIGALSALLGRRSNNPGRLIDLSVHEAALTFCEAGLIAPAFFDDIPKSTRLGVNRFSPTFPMGVYPAKDGWIGLTALTPPQWVQLCDMLEVPDLAKRPEFFQGIDRLAAADEIEAVLCPQIAKWPARDLALEGQRRRIPVTLVPTAKEALSMAEFGDRGAFEEVTSDSLGTFKGPGIPYRLTGTPARRGGRAPGLGEHTKAVLAENRKPLGSNDISRTPSGKPLAGFRILDLSMGWAGPLAARYCADMGAEIIKVEAPRRPDWWRGWEPTQEWVDSNGFEVATAFNAVNRNKSGITLDLTTPRGLALLKELVAQSDALIENNSGAVMAKLGLEYETLKAIKPDLVMVSMPTFGLDHPWSHHRAYGSTVEQASGIPHFNGEESWPPTHQHVALGDPVAGLNAASAMMLALLAREATGEGQFVDLSQVECLLPLGAHGFIEQSLNDRAWPRQGSRHTVHAPHGVFPARGEDSWLAITVLNDNQWAAMAHLVGGPDLASDARFASAALRKKNEADLIRLISDWSQGRGVEETASILQDAGVPAAPVVSVMDLLEDPHLASRDLIQWRERAFIGNKPHPGPAFLMDGERAPLERPSPTLGEHTTEVLCGLLGLDNEALEELATQDIIGTRPLVGT